MSSEVEKIKFMDNVNVLSSELFSHVSDTYARQDIHANTFREIAKKLRRLEILYSLPARVTCENGELVVRIDLSGKNLETILSNEEEGE